MVTLSFPAYLSNKSDIAINAPITTDTLPSLSRASTTSLFLLEEIGTSPFSPVPCLLLVHLKGKRCLGSQPPLLLLLLLLLLLFKTLGCLQEVLTASEPQGMYLGNRY